LLIIQGVFFYGGEVALFHEFYIGKTNLGLRVNIN